MSKKRIKIMIQGPNRGTYFRKGPIALNVSENQELENDEIQPIQKAIQARPDEGNDESVRLVDARGKEVRR